jgi:hypothetical protein
MPTLALKRLAVALVLIVGVVFLTIAAGGILLVRRYVTTEYVDAARAAQVFAEQRARLAGQVPLTRVVLQLVRSLCPTPSSELRRRDQGC